MGSRYLTEMPGILRVAGLHVIEEAGHHNRGRSSGGFDFNPFACFWHHTASNGGNTAGDIAYMNFNADAAPICNAYVTDDGTWHWMASGATNTNGSGNDGRQFSRGYVPADQANTHVVGVEARNNGVGERWPQVQIDSIFAGISAINVALGNVPWDVDTHEGYAPGRKIDPAVAGAVEGPWQPTSLNSSGTWDPDDVRAEFQRRAGSAPIPPFPPPPTTPPDEDDDMLYAGKDANGTIWISDGIQRWFPTWDEWNVLIVRSNSGGSKRVVSACDGSPITNPGNVTCEMDDIFLGSLGVLAKDA